ncbi:MAG: hypothetical protein KTR25_07815 [Myxococcales bacterium]|nr:hypothetical protein [Myxococcales bacterium]
MIARVLVSLFCVCATGCTDGTEHSRAIVVLVDVSGTYADQAPEVVKTIKLGILPVMQPGDQLVVARIDAASYERDNIEINLTLAPRRSDANAQKVQVARALDEFAQKVQSARYTDVTGAIMIAADYLRGATPDYKMLVIFSDLREDLPKGTRRVLDKNELAGMRVLALNVKRLKSDNRDPRKYRRRMDGWSKRLRDAGAADFEVFFDDHRLLEALSLPAQL